MAHLLPEFVVKSTGRADSVFTISGKRSFLPLALLAIGLILITLQLVSNVGGYVKAFFVPVEYPLTYHLAVYDSLLKNCVRGDLVGYKILVNSPDLSLAVEELERINPSRLATPRDRLVFWINAYNLLVLKNIAERYPIKSIRDVDHFMSLRKFVIGGIPYSVEDIQRQEIMPMLKTADSEAIFLMCGGAMGYPPLLDHAITTHRLDHDMTMAVYGFVNNPKNVEFDIDTGTFYISRFFNWYRELLVKHVATPFDFVNAHLDPFKKVPVADKRIVKVFTPQFNWWLNDIELKGMDQPRNDADEIDNLILEDSSQ